MCQHSENTKIKEDRCRIKMKILLISNMYPSKDFPSYGVFVKNTEQILLDNGVSVDKAVMTKRTGKLGKLVGYASHYLKIIASGLTKSMTTFMCIMLLTMLYPCLF